MLHTISTVSYETSHADIQSLTPLERPVYHWGQQPQAYVQQAESHAPDTRLRQDSATDPQMPEPGMVE